MAGPIDEPDGETDGTAQLKEAQKGSAPEGFVVSDDVRAMARRVIDRFPERFSDLVDRKIVYLLDEGKIPKSGEIDKIAKAQLAPALWAAIAGVEAAIWVNGIWWKISDDLRREAVVFHELNHFVVDPAEDVIRVVPHDIEAFIGEARFYGNWRPEFGILDEQLQLFARDQRSSRTG